MPHNRLVLMCGLPCSGKTTKVLELLATTDGQGVGVVSPDAIRLALHGERYVPQAEGMVWTIARLMVRSLFLAGHHTVIVDATNNTRARRDEWRAQMEDLGVPVLVWYVDTSAEECKWRAQMHLDTEIIPVIEKMAYEHEPPDPAEDELLWS